MNLNIKHWLKSKVLDEDIESIYSNHEYLIKPTKNNYISLCDIDINIGTYYYSDLRYLLNNLEYNHLNNYMIIINDKKIILPPNTNIFHANYLFDQLATICNNDPFECTEVINDYEEYSLSINIYDETTKERFYEFCYENTYKDPTENYKLYTKPRMTKKPDDIEIIDDLLDDYIKNLWDEVIKKYKNDICRSSILDKIGERDYNKFYELTYELYIKSILDDK